MTEHVSFDNKLIKKSIAYRAKYRLDQGPTPTMQVFSPALVVPHPKNRAGDPVKSLRTMELGQTVGKDGCDPVEANSTAVAVEEQPDDSRFMGSG